MKVFLPCKHREGTVCFYGGKCMKEDQIYQANLDNVSTNEKYEYIGSCSTKMRDRYENHKSDFKNIQRRTRSTLAEQVWKIKENNCEFNIEWKSLETSKSYKPGANKCKLCLREIYLILFKSNEEGRIGLNKRSELWGFCRHRNKWKVKHYI